MTRECTLGISDTPVQHGGVWIKAQSGAERRQRLNLVVVVRKEQALVEQRLRGRAPRRNAVLHTENDETYVIQRLR